MIGRYGICNIIGFFFFQAEDGIRDLTVTGVHTCALPICERTIPLARGREDDRMSALGQQLDDAVEVTGLGNVVEEEKDADDPYLIITPLDMLQLSPRAAAYGMGCLVAAAGACAATLAWRFLTFTGFTNDHYAHLALAQQWLLGDRPVRDFTD